MDQMKKAEALQGVKVLVIDDSKTIRRSAENLLAKEGYDVITATDGFDALAKIAGLSYVSPIIASTEQIIGQSCQPTSMV